MRLSIAIICCIVTSCKQDDVPSPESLYTKNLGATKAWHHTYRYISHSPYIDTTHVYPDTSFAISVINDYLIGTFGYKMASINSNYQSDTHPFTYTGNPATTLCYVDTNALFGYGSGTHRSNSLYYYFNRDSIRLIIESGGLGGSTSNIYTHY